MADRYTETTTKHGGFVTSAYWETRLKDNKTGNVVTATGKTKDEAIENAYKKLRQKQGMVA